MLKIGTHVPADFHTGPFKTPVTDNEFSPVLERQHPECILYYKCHVLILPASYPPSVISRMLKFKTASEKVQEKFRCGKPRLCQAERSEIDKLLEIELAP